MRFLRRNKTATTEPAPPPIDDAIEKVAADIETELKNRRTELRKRKDSRKSIAKLSMFSGAAFLAFGILTDVTNYFEASISILLYTYGAAFLFVAMTMFSTQALDTEIQSIEDDLDLLSVRQHQPALRAYVAFRRHQLDLNRYYNQSLSHGKVIFFVGIGCIAAGFVVIGVTLYLLVKHLDANTSSKILIGTVGAVGGILSNFIAALYLRMFTTISQSLTFQHDRLVATHFLHFGNFLVSKVETDTGLREETLSEMAKSLAGSANHVAIPLPEDEEISDQGQSK